MNSQTHTNREIYCIASIYASGFLIWVFNETIRIVTDRIHIAVIVCVCACVLCLERAEVECIT